VPNRDEAARWYATHLGFERVQAFDFWAHGFDGGPLQISADGGNTTLAHVFSFGSDGYRTRARGSQRGAVQVVHDASMVSVAAELGECMLCTSVEERLTVATSVAVGRRSTERPYNRTATGESPMRVHRRSPQSPSGSGAAQRRELGLTEREAGHSPPTLGGVAVVFLSLEIAAARCNARSSVVTATPAESVKVGPLRRQGVHLDGRATLQHLGQHLDVRQVTALS
jgi:catechol 2,3-dioxygenase-like lactoylglutathione lyase family enzyme